MSTKNFALKISSSFALILLFSYSTFSQNTYTIKGIVKDSVKALQGATITIKNVGKEDVLKGDMSLENGSFEITVASSDTVILEIKYIGYEINAQQIILKQQHTVDIGFVLMKPASDQIDAVSVTSKKLFITHLIDRVIVNPDALISNAGITASELLERCPGVLVDMNGIISMRGKNGVMIYIDDKPTYLNGEELAAYLKSIPSSSIGSIELLMNPPAKYDAAGNAGIIIIRLKKSIAKGWSGSIALSFGQGRFSRSNNSTNLQYGDGKINIFGSVSANYNQSYQDLTIERYYSDSSGKPASSFIQNSYITPISRSANIRAGIDYYLNEHFTIGITTGGLLTHANRYLQNTATTADAFQEVVGYVEATNPATVQFNNHFVNLNALLKLKDKSEFTFNLDYLHYDNKIQQLLTNKLLSPQREILATTRLESDLPTDIGIKSAAIGFTKPLNQARIEAGLKFSIVSTDNKALFYDLINGERLVNNEFTNRFIYDEDINAAYLNYSQDIKRISLQFGLRAEHTNIKGYQTGNEVIKDSGFANNYISFFPTIFAQYTFDTAGVHVLSLSAGRRIERPAYKDLNPFSYPLDRFTYYGGNPFLVPTFSYNIDLSYTYKNAITTTLTYSMSNDVIFETNEQRGTIYYSRPGNFAMQTTYGITINTTHKITPWWSLQIYSSLLKNAYKSPIYTEYLNDAKWYVELNPVNQFTINKKWNAELSANYQSTLLAGQFIIQPIYSVRMGVSTKILKEKAVVKLNISDVFYTNQTEGDIRNIANAKANWFSYLDSRVATISFSWRFSKGQQYKLRKTGSTEAEQQRIKS